MERVPVPEGTVCRVADLCGKKRIPYAFMGGLALNAWGVPRATFDLDIAVTVESEGIPRLLAQLRSDDVEVDDSFLHGFVNRLAGMEKAAVRLLSGGAWFLVDLFFATTPFLHSVMERRVAIELGETRIHVVTAADLVLFKLLAGRRKHWVDIENVIVIQGVPEPEYLQTWADRLGIRERLDRVLEQS
ncbi:MAG: hypothetical protein ACE5F1_22065 [Planctomycetota bacterium]